MRSDPGWISFSAPATATAASDLRAENDGSANKCPGFSPRSKRDVVVDDLRRAARARGGGRGISRLLVERFGSARAAVGAQGNLFDSLLGAPEQIIAIRLQSLAARVDCNRLLKPDSSLFELVHDLFEFLERILERQFGDICIGGGQRCLFPRLR